MKLLYSNCNDSEKYHVLQQAYFGLKVLIAYCVPLERNSSGVQNRTEQKKIKQPTFRVVLRTKFKLKVLTDYCVPLTTNQKKMLNVAAANMAVKCSRIWAVIKRESCWMLPIKIVSIWIVINIYIYIYIYIFVFMFTEVLRSMKVFSLWNF